MGDTKVDTDQRHMTISVPADRRWAEWVGEYAEAMLDGYEPPQPPPGLLDELYSAVYEHYHYS